jgi:hypothetical protein
MSEEAMAAEAERLFPTGKRTAQKPHYQRGTAETLRIGRN